MKARYTITLCAVATIFCFGLVVCVFMRNVSETTASSFSFHPAMVVIDAGHGGEDGGAVSVSGIAESVINLQVAKKLEQVLAFCGVNTHMIRNNENAIHTEGNTIRERKVSDLKNRVMMVNSFDHAILISIHQNHYPEEKYFGAQVFYADTNGSQDLAILTQSSLQDALNLPKIRQIKKAESAYLMNKIRCTGILVECGFLSNPKEDILLQNGDYQRKIACAIGCSVVQYIEQGSDDIEI